MVISGADRVRDSIPEFAELSAPIANPRLRYTINDHWRYAPDTHEGAAGVAFDDASWTSVQLPHTWNAVDGFDEAVQYRRGVGWYRKQLTLDSALRGMRIFLHFEGANQVADVYVNGHRAGQHIGGYTAFTFDVTDLVRFDERNVIAVRIDNRHDAGIPPLNADFTFYGGIYRDVWLVATSPVHVTLLDHASPGVFIDTPEVSAERATVRVRGTIANHTRSAQRIEIINRVLDGAGREVALLRSRLSVAAGEKTPFTQTSAAVVRPALWSPEEPNLYRVRTEVRQGASLLDVVENPLGFRWFRVHADSGFFLNGRPYRLNGTNRHQDRAGIGNALLDENHREDVRLVKQTGMNFLRLAHYPQDPAVLDEADRIGLVIWEEIPVVNIISMSDEFSENAERMLAEMIRQHYNHPSVAFWGYMNEVLLVLPDPVPEGYFDRVLWLGRKLEERTRSEDPSRITVTAISFDEVDPAEGNPRRPGTGFQDIPQVLGLNLYFGWYYRDLEGLGSYLDSLHARHPNTPILISEYGAGSDERIHPRTPRAFDFSAEHQQRYHEANFQQLAERPYLVGSAVWIQFDFGSKGRHDSKPNINQKGLYYHDRRPKDLLFYYRARLLAEPVLHTATRDWPRRAGSEDADREHDVVVYSNLGEVELLLNGTSLGRRTVSNATARWSVMLAPGENRLEAKGTAGGATVHDATTIHYEDRASFFRDAGSDARVFAVNAGSHYQYVDAEGVSWEADHPYQPGGWGHLGGKPDLRHHRVFGSRGEHALYQATLEGGEGYRFDVPDGSYEVRLLVVDMVEAQPGARVFDVSVNGRSVFDELDLVAQYGRHVAVDRTMLVEAEGSGGIEVKLTASTGSTTISGVMLRRR
jgi:beta-galactosidase